MTHLKFSSSTFVPQGHADTVTDNWTGTCDRASGLDQDAGESHE